MGRETTLAMLDTIARYTHRDSNIAVMETTDHDYARDCFDGSDREWIDVAQEAHDNNPKQPTFYIVSSGLSGLYMADSVSVFGSKADALQSAKDEFERWRDEDEDEEEQS